MSAFRWEIIEEYAPLFAEGAMMTIKATIICVILGSLWGLTLGLGRTAKAEQGIWKPILHYFVQWPVRLCQCLSWYSTICSNNGCSLCLSATVY